MHSRSFCTVIFASAFFLAAGFVSAGYTMTMTITPPDFSSGRNSTMEISLVNHGDEVGYKGLVQTVYPPGIRVDPAQFPTIAPNVTYNKTVNAVASDTMTPGTYPLIASLEFTDSNNYPIYMIYESRVDVGQPSSTNVFGLLSAVELPADGAGTLTLKVKNNDDAPHTVKTHLILPASLSVDNADQEVQLDPRSETTVNFRITNFMALESDFMVVATLEYDDSGHHASIARGRVKVVPSGQGRSLLILPAIVAAIVIVLLGFGYLRFGGFGGMKKWLLKPKKNIKKRRP